MNRCIEVLEGGCACGSVRYRLLREPMVTHACHCKGCQRLSGGRYAVNALIESHEVQLLKGELAHYDLSTTSGAGQTVARCVECSVAVWSNYHLLSQGLGDIVRFIRVGTLDDPSKIQPDVHIFDERAESRLSDVTAAPRYKEFYDLNSTWSRQSLNRLYALYAPQIPGLHPVSHAVGGLAVDEVAPGNL